MRQCCKDHNGHLKNKYKTQLEAENAAAHRENEGVTLTPYPCEEGDGWHLTSKNAPSLERPINKMRNEERKLYSQHKKNRMGALFDEELITQMRNEARDNTLSILERNIEPLQQDFNAKYKNYGIVRKQYNIAQKDKENTEQIQKQVVIAEQKLKIARQKLRGAKREYELAKKRIT